MKLEIISENISHILSQSTVYALPKVFQSKRVFFKIFWTLYFIGASFVTIWQVKSAINRYYDHEVLTQITSIYQQPMPFPTISFCPSIPNAFYNKSLKSILSECWDFYENDCRGNFESYFESFESGSYGICYRYNSGRNMSGHSTEIINSNSGGGDDQLWIRFPNNFSISVIVHDQSTLPKSFENENFQGEVSMVEDHSLTLLSVHKTIEKRLEFPYNDCYKDLKQFPLNKTIINYIQLKNATYKQTDCLALCFDILYLNENPCNCTNTSLGHVWNDCWIKKDKENYTSCTWLYRVDFYRKSILNSCQMYCPEECDSISYSVLKDSVRYDFQDLVIFFESLKYTSISELPKTDGFDFISNIAGISGIFIGASFVSFFEITEIIIEIFFILFEKKKAKNVITVKETLNSYEMSKENSRTKILERSIIELKEEINQLKRKTTENERLLHTQLNRLNQVFKNNF